MQNGTWIILDNGSGVLDRVFVPHVDGDETVDLNTPLYDAMTSRHWAFAPGDTVRFLEGHSEMSDLDVTSQYA